MLLLREDDVRAVLTMPATIDVLDAAFRAQGEGRTRNVPRSRILIPEGRGVLHLLSAYVPGEPGHPEREGAGVFGFKAYSASSSGVRFSVNLYSGEDGRLLALIEADLLGQMRTGAASGLATRYLARAGCDRRRGDRHAAGRRGRRCWRWRRRDRSSASPSTGAMPSGGARSPMSWRR